MMRRQLLMLSVVAATIAAGCTLEKNALRTVAEENAEVTAVSAAIELAGGEHRRGEAPRGGNDGPILRSIYSPTRVLPSRPFSIGLNAAVADAERVVGAILYIRGALEHITVPISLDAAGEASIELNLASDVPRLQRRLTMEIALVDADNNVGPHVINPFVVLDRPDALDVPALTLAVGTRAVESLAYPHDTNNRFLVTGNSAGEIALWDLMTGRPLAYREVHDAPIFAMVFMNGGEKVVSGDGDGVVIFTEPRNEVEPVRIQGHSAAVRAIAISDGSPPITATGGADGDVHIWNTETGEKLQTLSYEMPVNDVTFSPDGTRLAVGLGRLSQPGEAVVVNVSDWSEHGRITELPGDIYAGEVSDVEFSPDGTRLAVGHGRGSLGVWNVDTLEPAIERLSGLTDTVEDILFVPTSPPLIAAIALNGRLALWNSGSGDGVLQVDVDNELFSLALSNDGASIALGSGLGTVWVVDTSGLMLPEGS